MNLLTINSLSPKGTMIVLSSLKEQHQTSNFYSSKGCKVITYSGDKQGLKFSITVYPPNSK